MSSEISLEARDRPGLFRRISSFCGRAAFSQLGLVILVVVYVVLGAVLFEYLESGPEVPKRSAIQRSREECLKELWAITEYNTEIVYDHGTKGGFIARERSLPDNQMDRIYGVFKEQSADL